eukprot:1762706-Amphidinium_carterae.1
MISVFLKDLATCMHCNNVVIDDVVAVAVSVHAISAAVAAASASASVAASVAAIAAAHGSVQQTLHHQVVNSIGAWSSTLSPRAWTYGGSHM